ncbi:MAG: DNA-directed RNA polymerase subunit L [Candidatus Nanoarchaeia archaeon]|nr:DNA-directed RNA polymerase subunit L [Candidatus Nanoarchaeia archaeon]MDD5587673.1 DNA-directed RNA polymerase subunit L [Candidatus Nanoarchaeia archaeon]
MELNILEQTKTKLKFEIKGENHTLCNVLRKELTKNSDIAGYKVEHPLTSSPVFIVESKDPKKSLTSTISSLKKIVDELRKESKRL